MIDITDPDDPRLDDYRSLNDQRFRRALEGDELFIAEGFVAIERLLESAHLIRSVLIATSRLARFAHVHSLHAAGVPVLVADRAVIAKTVGFDLHRGVVAAATRLPRPGIAEVADRASRLAVLEGLNDAENLGAIARSARALDIDALVTDATCTDPYSRRSVRVSMGEILMLPVATATRPVVRDGVRDGVLGVLHRNGFETWAMTPSADAESIWALHVPKRVAVVLGAEGAGLGRETLDGATRRVRIPLRSGVDSLNVGHAAAVTFAAIGRSGGVDDERG